LNPLLLLTNSYYIMSHFVAGAALGRWASWYLPWSDENREAYRKVNQQVLDHDFSRSFRKGDEAFVLGMRSRSGGANLDAEAAALRHRHGNTINSKMGTNLRGHFEQEDPKPKKARSSSGNCSRHSTAQLTALVKHVHTNVEGGTAARAAGASYRLHPGKYVKCDPILKDFFFPLLTSKLNFGFSSVTGLGNNSWNDASGNTVEEKGARGLFRGVSFFKLRFTNPLIDRTNVNALNDTPIKVAGSTGVDSSGLNGDIMSTYRRYNSAPVQYKAGSTGPAAGTGPFPSSGASVIQTECQTFTEGVVPFLAPGTSQASDDSSVRLLGVGMNLAHLETNAYMSSNFRQSIENTALVPPAQPTIPIGTSNSSVEPNWNGVIPLASSTETGCVVRGTPSDPHYHLNQKDAVMRIADGQVSLDITNTCRSMERIEIVIHAMKKTSNDTNIPELYEAIYEGVDYAQRSQTPIGGANDTTNAGSNKPGGWQAFYDPEYPLLKTTSRHGKKVNDIAKEVHRSIHVLSPGQSKNVKIALGSLYYSLGNKSETPINDDDGFIQAKEDNVGSLAVCIGHTGFQALETMATTNSTLASAYGSSSNNPDSVGFSNDLKGGGFWAGRSFAPSSVLVGGTYVEKYYPLYFNSTQRLFGNFGVYTPSFFLGSSNTLPLANIPQEVVATTPAHNAGIPVGTANKTLSV
jgi:hypothetical protein